MRVLFASWAVGGHFAPLVPMGWAFRAAGHEVLVACPPADTGPIVRAGLPALPLGPDVDMNALFQAKRRGEPWRPGHDPGDGTGRRGYAGMAETAEAVAAAMAEELVPFGWTWRPDLVVYEPAAFAGPLLAGVLGIPAVRQLWTSDFTAPVNGFPAVVRGSLPERYGITEFLTTGDLTLDPCPPRLQVRDDLPRQPIRYVPYNGTSVLPDWLREPPKRPRLCVTWGATLHGLGAERMRHVPAVIRALGDLDVELVVAVLDAHRELLGDLPDNVISVGPVPLQLVLPTCAAIVHQGGGGTVMTAMSYGLPQVIAPTIPDQVFNASYLANTGAGIQVPGRDNIQAADVIEATREVLANASYVEAARLLREEHLARPTPADVVPLLEKLVVER